MMAHLILCCCSRDSYLQPSHTTVMSRAPKRGPNIYFVFLFFQVNIHLKIVLNLHKQCEDSTECSHIHYI